MTTAAQHIRNLLDLFDESSPEMRAVAMVSYLRYHQLLSTLAARYWTKPKIACGVFAALSPNNDYIGNLRDTKTLLDAAKGTRVGTKEEREHYAATGIHSFKVSTYHNNKRKAWQIAARDRDPLDEIVALKTRNFFLNCIEPSDPFPVTVDGHMFWAWEGKRGRVTGHKGRKERATSRVNAAKVTAKMYAEIADGIRFVAQLRSCLPNQAQAVIWQQYRRRYNIQGSQQLELICSDQIVVSC